MRAACCTHKCTSPENEPKLQQSEQLVTESLFIARPQSRTPHYPLVSSFFLHQEIGTSQLGKSSTYDV